MARIPSLEERCRSDIENYHNIYINKDNVRINLDNQRIEYRFRNRWIISTFDEETRIRELIAEYHIMKYWGKCMTLEEECLGECYYEVALNIDRYKIDLYKQKIFRKEEKGGEYHLSWLNGFSNLREIIIKYHIIKYWDWRS